MARSLRLTAAEAAFRQYAERSTKRAIGGLPAADPAIRRKLQEDLDLGYVEHIVGIAAHPVYLATDVASVLRGPPSREDGPVTLREAVSQATIRSSPPPSPPRRSAPSSSDREAV